MATGAPRKVDITALGPASAETVLWQMQGRLHVTVVVKASFAFAIDAAMTRVEADDILRAEVHHNKNPMRSVRYTGDLAPFLPLCDVVVTGHACAPAGTTVEAISARLVIFREVPLIDKTLYVRGDVQGAETVPFDRIPLMYERSFGGIGWEENPLGVGAGAATSAKSPNLFDPADPKRVAGFGPISRGWPTRKRLLGTADRKALDRPIAEIPAGFDWTYYQAAPLDQRTEYLTGSEWVILDGLNPAHGHIQSYLPAARAFARIHGVADGGSGHLLPLAADILRIDSDSLTCSVTWRASFPVQGEDALGAVQIFAGVESDGHPIDWPALPEPERPAPAARPMERPTAVLSMGAILPAGASTILLRDEPDSPAAPAQIRTVELIEPPAESIERPVDSIEIIEVIEDVTDLASSIHTEEFVDEPAPPATVALPETWAGAMAVDLAAASAAMASSLIPFPQGASALPSPMTERLPSSFEVTPLHPIGGRTLNIEEVDEPGGPRSLPFLKPPAPPPARPVEPVAPIVAEAPPPDSEPSPTRISQGQAAPPRPRSHGIEIFNDTALAFGVVPWGLVPSRDCLTVIAKATCDLVPGEPARLRAAADPLEGERSFDEGADLDCVYPSDFALYKVRADVVLTGHACAPKGPAPSVETRLALGSEGNAFERRVVVFGDRRWEPGPRATAPEPFLRMPLIHGRAFGGRKSDRNPIGLGYPDRARSGPVSLPNLEDPDHLLRAPHQIAQPACFAPIPRAWKERWASRGRNSDPWSCLPEELDWTLFQAAPPAQQLAFLRGDEAFEIAGMRREHPILTGALPGIRARALLVRRGAPAEVALRLDTVVFDLDAMTLQLIWRGTATVADERAPDIDALHLLTERTAADLAPIDLPRDRPVRR